MARREITLDTLLATDLELVKTAQALVDICTAVVLIKLGQTSVSISISDMREAAARYIVHRSYTEVDGDQCATITITEKDK